MTKKEMMMNHLLNQMPAYEEMLAVEAKKLSVSKLEVAIKLYNIVFSFLFCFLDS